MGGIAVEFGSNPAHAWRGQDAVRQGAAMRQKKPSVLTRLRALTGVSGVSARTCVPFAVLTGVHLAAQVGESLGVPGAALVAPVTKTLLMPALGAVAAEGLLNAKRRTGRLPAWAPLVAVGLTFSWFGDLALIAPDWFLAGVGLFGVAQVAYATTFARAGDASRTAGRPALAAPYVVWWVALLGVFGATQGFTPMTGAIAVYGSLLGTMAFLANRVSPTAAVGAGLFVLSDSLIGLRGSGVDLPAHGFWVMSTYLAAQWLIVRELVALAERRGSATPAGGETGAAVVAASRD